MNRLRIFAWLGVAGALWGLLFAGISTLDYASHLDRNLHDLHCSFIPGASASDGEGCRTALNSPYAAFFKRQLWGGIPISLLALGCFAFLLGPAAAIGLGQRMSRLRGCTYGLLALLPLGASLIMFAISVLELGTLCKTCVGIYMASALLAASGIGVIVHTWPLRDDTDARALVFAAALLLGMLGCVFVPSAVYAALAPDHSQAVTQCGGLAVAPSTKTGLLRIPAASPGATRSALFFEDPLCPTCKSLHDRLGSAGVLARLDVDLALFPLDSDCNWMLDVPLHPGACTLAKAVLCAESPGALLHWAYEHQSRLAAAGRAGNAALTQALKERWGAQLTRCMAERSTRQRLNRHLHFAVANHIAVSTPQVFIDGQRLCDEDIDMGLAYALDHLAPELVP